MYDDGWLSMRMPHLSFGAVDEQPEGGRLVLLVAGTQAALLLGVLISAAGFLTMVGGAVPCMKSRKGLLWTEFPGSLRGREHVYAGQRCRLSRPQPGPQFGYLPDHRLRQPVVRVFLAPGREGHHAVVHIHDDPSSVPDG
jgi:hypothetical protein